MTARRVPRPSPLDRAVREANRRVVEAERAVAVARSFGDRAALADATEALEDAVAAAARLTGDAK